VAAEYPAPGTRDERIRITAAELREALAVGRVQACDVRTAQEYSGEVAMSGRGGHLPGASHVPWDACLDSDRRFLPAARLEEALAPFLADPREPVPYCQGGIRASLTWFCLNELLGRPARLYAASWEEWAQDHSLPVEV
jgi:thiosulfate/3-mercaptopyruvate sulfurtransferase